MTFVGLPLGELLGLGAALASAMVLLYVLRLRRRRVLVPHAPLWGPVAAERQTSSLWRRLRRLLSLLVQLVLLTLLVLALGDPRPDGGYGCGFAPEEPPPPRHTLLLLDQSASMATLERGSSRLRAAGREAHRIIDSLDARGQNPAHRIMVATMDTTLRPLTLWTADRQAARRAIDVYVEAGARDTRNGVDGVLSAAAQIVGDREGAETILVTDRAFPHVEPEAMKAAHASVLSVGSEGLNVAIEGLNVRPYLDDSLTYAVFYAVRNHGEVPLEATLLLYANEGGYAVEDFVDDTRIIGSYALELPPGETVRDVIGDVFFEGSRLAARVVVSPDGEEHDVFDRDDVAVAVVPPRRRLAVQLVTDGNLFLYASLMLRENLDLEVVEPADYGGPEGYDVTVIDGVDVAMDAPGKYFLIDPPEGTLFRAKGQISRPTVGRVHRKHALVRNLKLVDPGILSAARLATSRGDHKVISTDRGAPLLLTRHDADGGRSFVVLAFDVRESLLPLRYAFPLLMVNVLNWFQPQPDGLVPTHHAGTPLSLPVPLPAGADVLDVKGPAYARNVQARAVADRLHFFGDRVGLYEVAGEDPDGPILVALNLMDREESEIAPRGDYGAWQAPPPYVPPEPPWPGTPWRALLIGALAIVAIEWWTWHRRITL